MKPAGQKTEVYVGLFVFCGLLLLGGLILQFSNIEERFRKDYPIQVTFRDSGGLTKGSPVRFAGTLIGRVGAITPRIKDDSGVSITTGVIVHLRVYEGVNIPKGAKITIGKEGLLGDSYINIAAPMDPIVGVLEENDTIAGREGGGLDDLQEAANEISHQTQAVLEDIRKGLVDLSAAIKKLDAEVLSQANLDHLKKSIAGLDSAVQKIDTKLLDDNNSENLKKTLANMSQASENFARQSERLDAILTKGDAAMTKFGQATDSLKDGGRSFSKAAETAGRTVGDINTGKGLMSALIHDPELRYDFRNLIRNMREHGVLFYKDKSETRAREAAPPRAAPSARTQRR
jgi:phospholipid/cholesterol/gamma-HCH transport system substrate-binding protein